MAHAAQQIGGRGPVPRPFARRNGAIPTDDIHGAPEEPQGGGPAATRHDGAKGDGIGPQEVGPHLFQQKGGTGPLTALGTSVDGSVEAWAMGQRSEIRC